MEDLLDPPQAELQRPHPAEKAAERVSDEFHVGVDGGLRIDGTNLKVGGLYGPLKGIFGVPVPYSETTVFPLVNNHTISYHTFRPRQDILLLLLRRAGLPREVNDPRNRSFTVFAFGP